MKPTVLQEAIAAGVAEAIRLYVLNRLIEHQTGGPPIKLSDQWSNVSQRGFYVQGEIK